MMSNNYKTIDRNSLMKAKMDKVIAYELQIKELLSNPVLNPYIQTVKSNMTSDNTLVDFVSKVLSLYSNKVTNSGQGVSTYINLMDVTERMIAHNSDLLFLLNDWCLDEIIKDKTPQLTAFPLSASPVFGAFIMKSMRTALEIGKKGIDLYALSESEFRKVLRSGYEKAKNYWLRNVRTAPLEDYVQLKPVTPVISDTMNNVIEAIKFDNPSAFIQGGGLEHREALALLTCEGVDTVADVGSGDGFMLPLLSSKAKKVVAIDKDEFKTLKLIMNELGNIVFEQSRLEEYEGVVDAAVVSNATFFELQSVDDLARLVKKRVVLSVPCWNSPLVHYLYRDNTFKAVNYVYKIKAFEPLRWARMLEKHFTDITIYCYDQRQLVIKADK